MSDIFFPFWGDDEVWDDSGRWSENVSRFSLLPRNATPAEEALEQTTALVVDAGVPLRELWNPDTCPAYLLPWLAWGLGVDEWDAGWSDEAKRNTISDAVILHRRKGTIGAIRRALRNAGYGDADVIERYGDKFHDGSLTYDGSVDHSSPDHWAEYRVRLARPITLAQAAIVRGILGSVAPVRCHLKELDFVEAAHLHDATIRYDGTYSYGAA